MKRSNGLFATLLTGILFFSGCVPTSKFNAAQQALSSARYDSAQLANKVASLQSSLAQEKQQRKQAVDSLSQLIEDQRQDIAKLTKYIDDLKAKNSDLSTESATRQSLLSKSKQELLNQQAKLERLQALMDKQKRSI